ncbi:hypothetical protein AB6C61_24395 [Vibrio splendidus]
MTSADYEFDHLNSLLSSNELGGNLFDGDIVEALELTMDFIPVVSNLKAVIEISTGKTIFGEHDIPPEILGLTAAAIFLGPTAKVAIRGAQFAKVTLKHSDDILGSLSHVTKKRAGTANVGDKVETPDSNPEKFTELGGGQMDKKTKEIWQKSNTNHSGDSVGEFKVGVGGKPPTPSKKITVTRSDCKINKKNGC